MFFPHFLLSIVCTLCCLWKTEFVINGSMGRTSVLKRFWVFSLYAIIKDSKDFAFPWGPTVHHGCQYIYYKFSTPKVVHFSDLRFSRSTACSLWVIMYNNFLSHTYVMFVLQKWASVDFSFGQQHKHKYGNVEIL